MLYFTIGMIAGVILYARWQGETYRTIIDWLMRVTLTGAALTVILFFGLGRMGEDLKRAQQMEELRQLTTQLHYEWREWERKHEPKPGFLCGILKPLCRRY